MPLFFSWPCKLTCTWVLRGKHANFRNKPPTTNQEDSGEFWRNCIFPSFFHNWKYLLAGSTSVQSVKSVKILPHYCKNFGSSEIGIGVHPTRVSQPCVQTNDIRFQHSIDKQAVCKQILLDKLYTFYLLVLQLLLKGRFVPKFFTNFGNYQVFLLYIKRLLSLRVHKIP